MKYNLELLESELKAINDEIYLEISEILGEEIRVITVMIDDSDILALSPEVLVLRPNVLDLIEDCKIDETELANIFKICVRNFKSAFKKGV